LVFELKDEFGFMILCANVPICGYTDGKILREMDVRMNGQYGFKLIS